MNNNCSDICDGKVCERCYVRTPDQPEIFEKFEEQFPINEQQICMEEE